VIYESPELLTKTTKSMIWLLRMNKLKTTFGLSAKLKVINFQLPYFPILNVSNKKWKKLL